MDCLGVKILISKDGKRKFKLVNGGCSQCCFNHNSQPCSYKSVPILGFGAYLGCTSHMHYIEVVDNLNLWEALK